MCTIVDDALDLRLIMHILHEFNASIVSHNHRPLLVSLVTPVKILHIKTMVMSLLTKCSMNVMYWPFFAGENLPRARPLPAPPCSQRLCLSDPTDRCWRRCSGLTSRPARTVLDSGPGLGSGPCTKDPVSTATKDSPTPAKVIKRKY